MNTLMRRTLTLVAMLLIAMPCEAAIKFFTDYPNAVPVGSDFFVLQRNQSYINSSVTQVKGDWFNNPAFTGNGSISGSFTAGSFFGDGSGLTGIASVTTVTNIAAYFASLSTNFTLLIGANDTNFTLLIGGNDTNYVNQVSNALYQIDAGGFIANNNGNGTNTTNWGVSTFQEIDATSFFPTNLYTGITNAPLLSTDSDGKIQNGYPLAATNVTYIAGANLTFTTNGDGSITIASSATITVTTVTNNTFVNTNEFISTSNAYFNIVYITNLYAETITNNTFVNTNTVIISGKASINTLIVTNVSIYGNLTNNNATASTFAGWDANKVLGSASLPSSALAAGLTDENGTGLVVFDTSPTLTTPNIGLANAATVEIQTNAWSGPTNTISFATEDQTFVSPTACSITGFTSKPTTNSANILLTLSNTSGTNWVLTIPTTVLTSTGVRGSVTVTNGQDRLVWIRYNPGTGHTNLVECPNF